MSDEERRERDELRDWREMNDKFNREFTKWRETKQSTDKSDKIEASKEEDEESLEEQREKLKNMKERGENEQPQETNEGLSAESFNTDDKREEDGESFDSITPELAREFKEGLTGLDENTIEYWDKVQAQARNWGFESKKISEKDAQKLVDQAVGKRIELSQAELGQGGGGKEEETQKFNFWDEMDKAAGGLATDTPDYWRRTSERIEQLMSEGKIGGKEGKRLREQAKEEIKKLEGIETEETHALWERALRGEKVEEPKQEEKKEEKTETTKPEPKDSARDSRGSSNGENPALGDEIQRRQLEVLQKQLERQEQQLEAQQRQTEIQESEAREGRAAFFLEEFGQRRTEQSRTNPKNERWFKLLDSKEKIEIQFRDQMLNFLEKKHKGTDSMKEYLGGLRIEKKDLMVMAEKPAFRMSMATITKELFAVKDVGGAKTLVLSDKGKEILSSKGDDYDIYRGKLVSKIAEQIKSHPEQIGFNVLKNKEDIDAEASKIALGYVGAAWNLLSVGLAVESADEERKISTSSASAYNSHWRRFIHPFNDAKSRWIKKEEVEYDSPERLFGAVGEWALERVNSEENKQFRQDFIDKKPGTKFFLERTVGSMFDHSFTSDGRTLTELITETKEVGDGLYDFADGADVFSTLKDYDVGGAYAKNIVDPAYKVFNLITTAEAKTEGDRGGKITDFIESVANLQKYGRDKTDSETGAVTKGDKLLRNIYSDPETIEDQFLGAIAAVSGGFKKYTTYGGRNELILEIVHSTNINYDDYVDKILKDDKDRLYAILGATTPDKMYEVMERLRKSLNAYPVGGWGNVTVGYQERDKIVRVANDLENRVIKPK